MLSKPYENSLVHENILQAIPDTGAEISVAGTHFMKQLGLNFKDIRPSGHQNLYAANNSEMKTLGKISVRIKYGN